jgi:peptide deformylase
MVLRITQYGEPVLREKGQPVEKFDGELHRLIDDMFDTMEAAHGIGLAAQQVGQPLQLCIVDVSGVEDRPSRLWLDGHESDVEEFMPLVLINPKLELKGTQEPGPEGCLSFPEIYGEVSRPSTAKVTALDGDGNEYTFECSGLLARCIQHEVDHLNGLLFIDRMDKVERERIRDEVQNLMEVTRQRIAGSDAASTRAGADLKTDE